ncbi:MAG: YbhB/YbcL family Raf kinase inhibitor-like protein [Candidatus Liptonbacteria bacterium]|nr:YbhB/YbcL family Raf kinase inhibitor-like protein [Candidatus Liptonbacteria bacterium]
MIVTSPSFKDGEMIPKKFTCNGGNINPELQIQNVPLETKSLALIMDDPDAPTKTFTHWLAWNIAASPEASLAPAGRDSIIVIKEESVPPDSVEGMNGTKEIGYIGPCPPSGTHHYHFKLYALDAMLKLQTGAAKTELEAEINKHLIAKAELVGLYQQ